MKIIKIVSCIFVAICFVGCGPNAMNVNPDTEFTTMGLDYDNLKQAMNEMIDSLIKDPYVQKIEPKSPKIVAISDIVNDTTQKVDVEALSRELTRAMRKSGKFRLTMAIARSGGSVDSLINDSRKLRNDKEFNQYTTVEEGTLSAPSLSLSGRIGQTIHRMGKNKKVDYYILLTLTDIKTGEVVWDNQKDISKIGNANLW